MPRINVPLTLDTECVDPPAGVAGPKTLTWLGSDVPQWIASDFRVDHRRTGWAVVGVSYGGWCAAVVGMHNPRVFGAAASFMGYAKPEFTAAYEPFASDPEGLRGYDLAWLARHDPPPIAVWLMASKEDRGAYAALSSMLGAVRSPMSVTAHVIPHGCHNIATVPPTVPALMAWLAKTLPGFRPHP